ncbi:hypothetical protein H6CHR_05333 [Variovorax sp. PBL-H6]|uniref:hypothetical protein n=1 Tax=Variovorax sp. PBL-H6 TaxID=434009 RepID=UPI001318B812|nr:hypothetical protein [Variovorax sp. PBL-H6]VTU38887.1 hypothetical protein H6CHR_05333 [Variovorax sp. PBL-H6]
MTLSLRTAPAALLAAALIAGCAGEPTRLAMGSSREQTLSELGAPTAVYALPGGGERLQYSRAPAGFEVNNVDLDASRHVVAVRQELDERLFDRTIEPNVGRWREADVLRTYGRPFEITRVSSFDGNIWTWRYKWQNSPRLLYIYIDPTGVVQRYHTGDDLMLELLAPL